MAPVSVPAPTVVTITAIALIPALVMITITVVIALLAPVVVADVQRGGERSR